MRKNLGMPYMGSKRKLAPQIVDFMIKENPNAKYIYDLFGGGGAISFYALQHPQIETVFYNELDSGVVSLLKDIRDNGVTEKYYQWVSRENFQKHKNGDDWFAGLCKVVWSFGNNQRCYIFGKKIENLKKLAHLFIVDGCNKSRKELECELGLEIPSNLFSSGSLFTAKTINEKRLLFSAFVRENKKRFDLEQLERLQQLEQLERLQQLEIINKSYNDVLIETPVNETIIYLDPPYRNTAIYQKEICHGALYNFIENSQYKIYLSSYESHLPCVLEMRHRSLLSATNNSKMIIEKLFTNRI